MILFFVEFGKPDRQGYSSLSFGEGVKEVYVLADTYREAESKALNYAIENTGKQSIVDSDGSLSVGDENIYLTFVKKISIISDKIIQ
jgi:hypothetical protein